MLADLIEVPNLAPRGRQYWSYLMRHYRFGAPRARDFPATLGERVWFLLLPPVSAAYRTACIMILITSGRTA